MRCPILQSTENGVMASVQCYFCQDGIHSCAILECFPTTHIIQGINRSQIPTHWFIFENHHVKTFFDVVAKFNWIVWIHRKMYNVFCYFKLVEVFLLQLRKQNAGKLEKAQKKHWHTSQLANFRSSAEDFQNSLDLLIRYFCF